MDIVANEESRPTARFCGLDVGGIVIEEDDLLGSCLEEMIRTMINRRIGLFKPEFVRSKLGPESGNTRIKSGVENTLPMEVVRIAETRGRHSYPLQFI
jgi:hypothetical protein